MKTKTLFLFTLLAAVLLAFGATTVSAQSPDGETPASEAICDELIGFTPGLYGLCIAFNEAQDCVPDFSLEDPLENCKPASRRILDNYNRKKQPEDPAMPGFGPPPGCPCWTAAELDVPPAEFWGFQTWSSTVFFTGYNFTTDEFLCDVPGSYWDVWREFEVDPDRLTCRYYDCTHMDYTYFDFLGYCIPRCTGVQTHSYFTITSAEAEVCVTEIEQLATDLGVPLP